MMESSIDSSPWTEKQVLRASRNSLIWNGISLLVLAIVLWLTADYFYCFFRGPVLLTDAQLLEVIERNGQRSLIDYVDLRDRTLIPTNWQEVSTKDGKPYSTVPFFLLPVGERSLIAVLAESQNDGKKLIGPLGPARELDQRVISAVVKKHPEFDGRILPIVLSNVAAFNVGAYVLLVFLVPWGTYCSWNIARAVMARANPSSHSIERQLAKSGDASTLAESINHDVAAGSALPFGKAILTDSWVLRPTVFGATCVRLQDVVWAYHVQRNSESFVVLCLRTGKTSAIFLKRQQADELVTAIARRVPWVTVGYDSERWKQWQKNREQFIAQSEARRNAV